VEEFGLIGLPLRSTSSCWIAWQRAVSVFCGVGQTATLRAVRPVCDGAASAASGNAAASG
jgi:hypothetical protein